MRILHLYKAYPPVKGGIENTIELLAEAQAAAGHRVTVIVSNDGLSPDWEVRNGVSIVRLGRLAELASTPLSPGLPLHLAIRGADIAHVHSPYPPAEAANWLAGRARRTVITWHSDVVRQQHILRFYAPLLRRILAAADLIFPTSQAYLARSPWLQPVADHCRVIPLGIKLEAFGHPDPRGAAQLRLRWSADGLPVVLFLGRLRNYKGLPHLIDAMPSVEARLVIVGSGPEGDSLRAQAARLGLGDRVLFAGHLPDVELPAAYQAADLFALPSQLPSEAFGLVMVEAMASGLPVVCTELGTGTSFVNQHEQTGLVVPPADPAALAAALNRLLGDDKLRQRFAAAGRARAQREFSAETYLRRTEEAYLDVLG